MRILVEHVARFGARDPLESPRLLLAGVDDSGRQRHGRHRDPGANHKKERRSVGLPAHIVASLLDLADRGVE